MPKTPPVLHDIGHTFKHVTDAEKVKIVNDSNAQFERTLFGHQMNLTRVLALPSIQDAPEGADEDTLKLVENRRAGRERAIAYEQGCIDEIKHALAQNVLVLRSLDD